MTSASGGQLSPHRRSKILWRHTHSSNGRIHISGWSELHDGRIAQAYSCISELELSMHMGGRWRMLRDVYRKLRDQINRLETTTC